MRVIGTAGHVDHGKSTLVEALTGVHPDRLKEEQEREMTIDLGFAWLTLPEAARLPDADEIGIVDVPGHRDFIDNMLAGVGGIDAALFVIAADEGVMPQSREHLAILDLLEIQTGVIALTKIDLVEDSDWLDLVEEEVLQLIQGTALEGASIVRVSAISGAGLEDLIMEISAALAQRPPRPDLRKPRLPVDRVFTIAGFGTVVTGTLSDGHLSVGDEVIVLPGDLGGRIRGIQNHQQKAETAQPGSRTAVNVSGLDKDQILRGNVLAHPGDYLPTRRIDVEVRLLPDAEAPIKHDMEAKLFVGAAEALARIRLLGSEILRPGESGWLQLELREPVVATRGDRYILRRPSPGATLGGGRVLDPHPAGRHRRFSAAILTRMEALAAGSPKDILLQTIQGDGPAPYQEIADQSGLLADDFEGALQNALSSGTIRILGTSDNSPKENSILATEVQWQTMRSDCVDEIAAYHHETPLRKGIPKEELRSRLKLDADLFQALVRILIKKGELTDLGPVLALSSHEIRFNPAQEEAIRSLDRKFAANPNSPPSVKEAKATVGKDVYDGLVQLEALVPVSPDVVYRKEDYDRIVANIKTGLSGGGTISVAEFRDQYHTSRKYALALLEHLDEIGVTRRDGDVRRLRSG